jgi:hypothetical protein
MKDSIEAAVSNIAKFGDTDIFPFSFEQHVFHDRPELAVAAIERLHKEFDTFCANYGPDNINTLAPIGYTGFRWATQIDVIWNAYYLALVLELAPEIGVHEFPSRRKRCFHTVTCHQLVMVEYSTTKSIGMHSFRQALTRQTRFHSSSSAIFPISIRGFITIALRTD